MPHMEKVGLYRNNASPFVCLSIHPKKTNYESGVAEILTIFRDNIGLLEVSPSRLAKPKGNIE